MKLTLWRAALAALLLSLPLSAQLVVRGSMVVRHESRAGKLVKGELIIQNTTNILQSGSVRVSSVKSERDMSKWIEFTDANFIVQARSAVRIKYRARVPRDTHGSYWTKFVLSPSALARKGTLKIRLKLIGYIIVDLPGGESNIAFSDCEYRNGNLFATLENTGTIAYHPPVTFYVGGKEYKAQRRLLFPGEKALFAARAVDLTAGRVIVLVDCGEGVAYGTQWTIEGVEAIKEFTTIIPVRMNLQSDLGPGGNRLLASLSTVIGRFSLGMGSFLSTARTRVNFSLGYRTRRWSLRTYAYKQSSTDAWRFSVSSSLNIDRWSVMINTQPFTETGQLSVRYRFSRGYLGLRASLVRDNIDWNLSVSLPLTLNLKFRRRVKEKAQSLKTFIVR